MNRVDQRYSHGSEPRSFRIWGKDSPGSAWIEITLMNDVAELRLKASGDVIVREDEVEEEGIRRRFDRVVFRGDAGVEVGHGFIVVEAVQVRQNRARISVIFPYSSRK